MSNQIKKINILDVSSGAVQERINIEIKRTLDNLSDLNTDAAKARKVTIELVFKNKNDDRDEVTMSAQVKSSLAPYKSISADFFTERTKDGIVAVEAKKPDRNQVTFEEERGEATTNVLDLEERRSKHA